MALFAWAASWSLYLRWWGIATGGTIIALRQETNGEDDTYKPVVAFTTRDNRRIEGKNL